MARIFEGLVQDKEAVINAVMKVIEAVPNDRDFRRESVRVEEELQSLEQKKDRLLEMSIAGAINMAEFKKRNDGFNDQMQRLELQLAEIRQEEEKSKATEVQMQAVRAALEQKLSFENGVDAALVTTILDHIVVKKGSTRDRVELEIFLKFGDPQRVIFRTEKHPIASTLVHNVRHQAEIAFDQNVAGLQIALGAAFQVYALLFGGERLRE